MIKITEKNVKKARNYIRKNFAQIPSANDRVLNIDTYSTNKCAFLDIRDDFTRDKYRILYSKSFRRLQHKAQVYSHERRSL